MYLDYTLMIANALAYNGTPAVIDLRKAGIGPGEKVRMIIIGSSDLAGATGYTVTDGTTNAASTAHSSHTCTLAGKAIEFVLNQDVSQYVKVALQGSPSAGTWTCGVIGIGNAQTNV